jgi:peptidoglycan-N-acetylglucosamine deacetylase
MRRGPTLVPLAPAHLAGLGAFQAAAVLAFFDLRFAAVPLALFLFLCLMAPFIPGFGFFLPIVSRGRRDRRAVALTFDDGPDRATTLRLLELLSMNGVTATFFVTGLRAAAHRDLVREILSRGHSVGNHSYRHSPFLMLKGTERLRGEIIATQSLLAEFGIRPLIFRPPVGITNPRLWRVLLEAGMYCVNFSLRARDAGNRRIGGLSRKILKRVKPGDIILLHDVAPGHGFDAERWLREVENIITGLKERTIDILPLADLIGRPVMATGTGTADAVNPVGAFYDAIAGSYDRDRGASHPTPASAGEHELFEKNYLPRISPEHRVLEIGAGTGLYTLPLARRCREITAVELSENMLTVLTNKAAREGISNIICKNIDIADTGPDEQYDSICAFSSFEYIPDLEPLIRRLTENIKPGGTIFFTTAHRSLFRFFTQIGNAMRQGLWLHARTEGEVRRILASSGFDRILISTRVMKWRSLGGLILAAMAEKNGGER